MYQGWKNSSIYCVILLELWFCFCTARPFDKFWTISQYLWLFRKTFFCTFTNIFNLISNDDLTEREKWRLILNVWFSIPLDYHIQNAAWILIHFGCRLTYGRPRSQALLCRLLSLQFEIVIVPWQKLPKSWTNSTMDILVLCTHSLGKPQQKFIHQWSDH